MRIKNFGHSDAEDIVVSVRFNSLIQDISLDAQGIGFEIIEGTGFDAYVTGKITRLVPKQQVSIFFAVDYDYKIPHELKANFVKSIVFKGGQGKTGEPKMFPFMVTAFAGGLMILVTAYFANKVIRKTYVEDIETLIKKMKDKPSENNEE